MIWVQCNSNLMYSWIIIWAVLIASMMSFQKIYGLHGLNHQIIEYSKKVKVITDKHTDTQNFLL